MPRPVSLMIKPVSGACNMRCRYCFYTDVMAHRGTAVYPRMTPEVLEAVVRRAFQYADGPVSFAFQGGEPTLIGLPFFEELVRLEKTYNARAFPVQNAVQTNGFELSDDMIAFFARERFLLGLSMDGTEETHDSLRVDKDGAPTFARVRRTAERLRDAGAEFNILCVVTDPVARQPREVFRALAPYGHVQFIACLDGLDGERTPYSLSAERYLAFLKQTFDLYYEAFLSGRPVSVRGFDNYVGILLGLPPENCAMGGRCGGYFLVESDGGVYPCDFYVLDEWRMGSVTDAPLERLARSDAARRFVAASLPVPDACRACRWYPLCRNGCRRERDETGLNVWCGVMRAFFAYAFPRMEKMAARIRAERRKSL